MAILGYVLAALLAAADAAPQEPAPPTEAMRCEIGPINRTYGGASWFVFSCTDGQTLVFASANPTVQYVFMVRAGPQGVLVHGQGPAPTADTEPAAVDLRALTPSQVSALIAETRSAAGL